jgi:hypothetical protein
MPTPHLGSEVYFKGFSPIYGGVGKGVRTLNHLIHSQVQENTKSENGCAISEGPYIWWYFVHLTPIYHVLVVQLVHDFHTGVGYLHPNCTRSAPSMKQGEATCNNNSNQLAT